MSARPAWREPAWREEDGFTLVETIVAFAILALVISTAVTIVGNGSKRERFDQARMSALSHARSELAAMSMTGAVRSGTTAGRYDDGMAWRIIAAPIAVSTAAGVATLPYAVSVAVYNSDTTGDGVTLKSVVIGPAPTTTSGEE